MIMFEEALDVVTSLPTQSICYAMQSNSDDSVTVTSTQSDEELRKLVFRCKRNVRKIITLTQLIKGICISQEKCIEWLKNKGLIPRVLFCPKCNSRMKFEENVHVIDGYVWICKECADSPIQISARYGSWLENRDCSLSLVLLYTYLWAHDFPLEQICKETYLPLSVVEEWNVVYCTMCHSLYQKSLRRKYDDHVDGNCLYIDKESSAQIWKRKNQSKDPFLQFLKEADSL